MPAHVVDVTLENFQEVILETSMKTPVVVDFWAPWCEPCKALGPVLEKLAAEYGGRFTLAKINADDYPQIAQQFGVRSIPSVKAVVQGQLADEFNGALPEAQVRAFLDRLLPDPVAPLREEAKLLRAEGKLNEALAKLAEASAIKQGDEDILLDSAEVLIELNRGDEARAILASIEASAHDQGRLNGLKTKLEFQNQKIDLAPLQAALEANPTDGHAALELAEGYCACGRHRDALETLLVLVRRDRHFNEDAGRKHMIRIFDMLGSDNDLAREYRRKLAAAIN